MERFFNTAGPNQPSLHYTLPPMDRVDAAELSWWVDAQRYFVLHAPRQSGKTGLLLDWAQKWNEEGRYRALYVDIEVAQAACNDVGAAMGAVLGALASAADVYWNDSTLCAWTRNLASAGERGDALRRTLEHWARQSPLPLVLFFDEVDALCGDPLVSLLRQICAGYAQRPTAFPHSIVLCGVRDIRDDHIHQSDGGTIAGASVFHIEHESIRLPDFSQTQIAALLGQHTAETGQRFDDGVLEELWEDTRGQPWLVNALAFGMCFRLPALRDRSRCVTVEHLRQACERLILRCETHLDRLADRLCEPGVRDVVVPLLQGDDLPTDTSDDDRQYCVDLGLLARRDGALVVSNRIYREVLPRTLSAGLQDSLQGHVEPHWYVLPTGRLDMAGLLTAFQQFFREHAQHWLERYHYKEAGPQLLLQAFLQRVVDGAGRIAREYGLGMGRTDLLLQWPLTSQGFAGPIQRVVLELKAQQGTRQRTLEQGMAQIVRYGDQCGADEAHLVLFDRNPYVPWEQKIFRGEHHHVGRAVMVWGM